MEKLMRMKEVSEILGVSAETLREWGRKGYLVPVRTFGNQRRYFESDIKRFLEERRDKKNEDQPENEG